MAQTAVDRMDEYLGMKDGPERNFSQTLQDRRDESIGATESDLVDRLFKSVQDAFQNGQTITDADRDKLKQGVDPQVILPNISDAERNKLMELYGRRPQPTEIEETTEVITESPEGAAALDETAKFYMGAPDMSDMDQTLGGYKDSPGALSEPELPPAMELAQMGYGMGSGYAGTPKLREGLGTMIDEAQAAAEPLSKYEQMLLLASLGIPAAALGGRAVGGLLSKLGGPKLGRPIPPRSGPAAQRILGGVPSAMRDMGPQAGSKGLESLKKFMGKESLRRPQVSKMAGPRKPGIPAPTTGNFGKVSVNPNTKEVFERAMSKGAFPKSEVDNWMYMYSDDVFDVFKDTITRKSYRVPKAVHHKKVDPFPSSGK